MAPASSRFALQIRPPLGVGRTLQAAVLREGHVPEALPSPATQMHAWKAGEKNDKNPKVSLKTYARSIVSKSVLYTLYSVKKWTPDSAVPGAEKCLSDTI